MEFKKTAIDFKTVIEMDNKYGSNTKLYICKKELKIESGKVCTEMVIINSNIPW